MKPKTEITPTPQVAPVPRDLVLDTWFTYHAPNDETKPKYAAIAAAVKATEAALSEARFGLVAGERASQDRFEMVTKACRALVEAIDEHCPPCADATAAIRCVRLARNAANDILCGKQDAAFHHIMNAELIKARYQANAAIACGGV